MRSFSNQNQTAQGGPYSFAGFTLHPDERRLTRGDEPVALKPKALDTLILLAHNAGTLVTHDRLRSVVWQDTAVADTSLTNTIVVLRRLLGHSAIETVPKHGYRFVLEVASPQPPARAVDPHYRKAEELAAARTIESMTQARDRLFLCTAADPSFALAWALLARCCRFLAKFGSEPEVNAELTEVALQRAFALDPGLAPAHQLLTQMEVDRGEARRSVPRLLRLLGQSPAAEHWAALVTVLRYCGLLPESIEAHRRAVSLSRTITTSVAHTHFLVGDYGAAIQAVGPGRGFFLDAAAWAAMGHTAEAAARLRSRLQPERLSPLMHGLMASLLAALEGDAAKTFEIVRLSSPGAEPEALFYFARNLAITGDGPAALETLLRAQSGGFHCSYALERDPAFDPVRRVPGFPALFAETQAAERTVRHETQGRF